MSDPNSALFRHFFGHLLVRHLYSRRQRSDVEHRFSHQTSQHSPGPGWRAVNNRKTRQQRTVYLRGTWASVGEEKKSQRLALGIKATHSGIEEAKGLARRAWSVIKAGGDPRKALRARQTALRCEGSSLSCSEAISEWERRYRTDHEFKPNDNGGFNRLAFSVRNLLKGYENSTISAELLVKLVEQSPVASDRRRKEKSAAIQIARANSLDTTPIFEIKTKYRAPKREVPDSVEHLEAFLDALRGTE